jgi:hypothetical protein
VDIFLILPDSRSCGWFMITYIYIFFFLLPCLNILLYILYICVCSYILLYYCIVMSIYQSNNSFPFMMCICSLANCCPSRALDWLIKYLIWLYINYTTIWASCVVLVLYIFFLNKQDSPLCNAWLRISLLTLSMRPDILLICSQFT